MRLLQWSNNTEFSLTADLVDEAIPPYAILSHTWLDDTQEPTFEDLTSGTGKEKIGYKKIQFCGGQAKRDNLQYFWVDTCCINKSNHAELSHAINSMFRWYRNAARCYVYLSDVSSTGNDGVLPSQLRELDLARSRWFTRGWTLQELLAPRSVEFFSRERMRLGDSSSLKQQIHQITGVPTSALEGARLSEFSVEERFLWVERRQTKVAEDKIYSLLGILDVEIPLYYGEGAANASKRVKEVIDKREKCLKDLHITDPSYDKKRIEDTKGGLLKDSYRWILYHSEFRKWRNTQQTPLLWIKGDPGKGKTMLICGIINELKKSTAKTHLLSYFFCQATDSRINTATAVLRGLLYLLVNQQPSLISHIQKKHDCAGKALFEDANAWVALSDIFTNILQDPRLNSTYLVVDALDECIADLPKLLDFIVQKSTISCHAKWIVSSRNWPDIEERLERAGHKMRLCLELNTESVSSAVSKFIQHKVLQLAHNKKYDRTTQKAVSNHLSSNANDTFLWVALVCENLEKIQRWDVLTKLNEFPPGLDSLYERMIQQVSNLANAILYKQILAVISAVYRPITLKELTALVEMPEGVADKFEALSEIIGLCGSFLAVREHTIFFVHQSAKDFLLKKASSKIFRSSKEETHHEIVSRSLKVMSKTLRRDIYNLGSLGYPIEQVKQPDPDPLAASRYSCIYWIHHLYDWNLNSSVYHSVDLQIERSIDCFIKKKYLYWLEALSLCKSMSIGVVSMAKLEAFVQGRESICALPELVRDARRFIMYFKWVIENNPLQAYASALLFSPAHGLIRGLFKQEEPDWITIIPAIEERWSACLQTLEGHRGQVHSVTFSSDSSRLASGSADTTIKIWDTSSGECLQILEGHSNYVWLVAFSRDSTQLASGSDDNTIKIWDANSGECLLTLKDHSNEVWSVAFSHDSTRFASGSKDTTVKIWDASSGECLQTLTGHSSPVSSVTFSHDSAWLASASYDKTVKVWDASSSECLLSLEGHSDEVWSVAFSHDSAWLASASHDKTVKIWDTSSGKCLQTLKDHNFCVTSVAFSHDSTCLASGSADSTIKIWDASTGKCLQTLEGHNTRVNSVAFSHDSAWLASASHDHTVKIWDASSGKCLQTLEGHSTRVNSVAFSQGAGSGKYLQMLDRHKSWVCSVIFSPDLTWFASASDDRTVKIWDVSDGKCLQTLRGHSSSVWSLAFSLDSTYLASASAEADRTVKIWDPNNGACLQTLRGHSHSVLSVTFSPDSTRLASGSHDNTVKIWDARRGKCIHTLDGHCAEVRSVAFSSDSSRLLSGSADNTIKIWDASSGACLQTLEGHRDRINSVAFSNDSIQLASASEDKTVKIWNASSGACLQTLEIGKALFDISFNDIGSCLHTNFGTIPIDRLSVSHSSSNIRPQAPRYQGWGLSLDGWWITFNSENLIWIPTEYRPSHSAVSAKMVGIVVGTGKVWICSFGVRSSQDSVEK